jgi:hypothetical protein
MNIRRFRALHVAGPSFAEIGRERGCDWRTFRKNLAEDAPSAPPANPLRAATRPRMITPFIPLAEGWLRTDIDLNTVVSQFALPLSEFPKRLVPARAPHVRIYALSQTAIARYDDDGQPMTTIFMLSNPQEERLMSMVAHPSRDGTLFLGTTRGVYISENEGAAWQPYRLGMPSVPITNLLFDQGFLYAATYGRGLWRCTPC